MDLRLFWATWRRDLIRGAMLFTLILIAGLTISSFVGRVRRSVTSNIPAWAPRPPRPPRPPGPPVVPGSGDTAALWTWTGKVAPKQWVRIKNVNGDVDVEPAVGDSLVVMAEKSGARSDRGDVRVVAVPGDGVTICALWENDGSHCGAQGDYEPGALRRHPVRVHFTVRLPRGVKVDAYTVNGDVTVAGATAPVKAQTVHGRIDVRTSAGPLEATNVNGSVRATISGFAERGKVEVKTVNGAVTLELPAKLNAVLEATTLIGSVDTDFPLTASEGILPRRFTATVGTGGREIRVQALHGSIRIRKITPLTAPAPKAPAVPARKAPAVSRTTS